MVHHSDEGGRPFWPEIDYPLHAFVPGAEKTKQYAIENKYNLVRILKDVDRAGYQVVMPPNWESEIGELLTKEGVKYMVPTWEQEIRERADLVRKEIAQEKSMSGALSRLEQIAEKSSPDRTSFYTGNRLLDLERTLKRKNKT